MLGDTLLSLLDGGEASSLLPEIERALSLSPPKALERATALYVWKRAWESALPASRHGGDRKSDRWRTQDQGEKISFCSVASAAIGVGERAVQLDIALCEQLGHAAIKRLWQSPIADNAAALKAVAALDEGKREHLFAVWNTQPRLPFGQAMLAAQLRVAEDTDEAQFLRLLDGWQRAGSKTRRRFLMEIGLDDQPATAVVTRWRKRGGQ
jgi:hypothetical protein